MSTTVQTVYDTTTFAMCEDGGFVLGIVTEQQFLDIFNVVILDFAQRAALYKNIFTQPIQAGVSQYTVPDDVMKPELCFVGGKIIEKTTEPDLMNGHFQWRRKTGPVQQWHEDNLPPKMIELFPVPDFNGVSYPSTDTPPGDPSIIGIYDAFNPADNNLTIVGPAAPDITSWAMSDTIQCCPDSFTGYLVYGILEQIFSSESEARDLTRANYCRARYSEGLAIADAIAREELMEKEG